MLTPNATYKMNGVTVKEKIIPDGTKWQDDTKAKKAGFSGAGASYKSGRKLCGTGKAKWVTIHNTNDITGVYDDCEQYTRATYNENMGSVRVHFYVDDTGAWQNLKAGTGLCSADPANAAEVSWHSGDGSVSDGGNMTSLSMEIIMGESTEHDELAKDNGARIAAWLLWKNGLGINKLVTHTYWVNKSAGKSFADVDKQCTNLVSGKKWCPSYIFASYNASTAYANWKKFKALVEQYLNVLNGTSTVTTVQAEEKKTTVTAESEYKIGDEVMFTGTKHYTSSTSGIAKSCTPGRAKITNINLKGKHPYHVVRIIGGGSTVWGWVDADAIGAGAADSTIKVGDKVMIDSGVTKYYNGVTMANWVKTATLYVRAIEQSGKVYLISTEPTKNVYTGRVNAADVHKI